MAFITTNQVLDRVADLLEQRYEKRSREIRDDLGVSVGVIRSWGRGEWSFPNSGRGKYPIGVVDLDRRQSERREQDTGETATFDLTIRVYFDESASMPKAKATKYAAAYGDCILYTLQMEALGKRPKDDTVLGGWFRVWPQDMTPGEVQEQGLFGVEVKAQVIVDSSYDAAE